MEAIVSEFPAVRLLVLHGPYVSEPATPACVIRNQSAGASAYELLGPFFVGLLEGASPETTIIDGGVVYQYRSSQDFSRSRAWRSSGIASEITDSSTLLPRFRDEWSNRVSISFGVYNKSWPHPNRDKMTPEIMEKTLGNALRSANDLVWCFTEGDNWLAPGKMPKEWDRAVRRARRTTSTTRKQRKSLTEN